MTDSTSMVEVQTVGEDDSSVEEDFEDATTDGFDDEEVFVEAVEHDNNGRHSSARAPSGSKTNKTSSFIPDPEEWTNVVNTAANAFMAASSADTLTSDDDDADGSLLPHPDEMKVTSPSNNTTSNNGDEPNHMEQFVTNTDGATSLPHPDDDPFQLAINSTSHAASLPHADEVKTGKSTEQQQRGITNNNDDEPQHGGSFLVNNVGVGSLPHPDETAVSFNVNATDHGASLPHADELKVGGKATEPLNRGRQFDEPQQQHPGLDGFQVNATSSDQYGASLPHADELKAGLHQQPTIAIASEDEEPSFVSTLTGVSAATTFSSSTLQVPSEVVGDNEQSQAMEEDDNDHGLNLASSSSPKRFSQHSRQPSFGSQGMVQKNGPKLTPNAQAGTSLPQPGDADNTTFRVNSTDHGASLPNTDEVKMMMMTTNADGQNNNNMDAIDHLADEFVMSPSAQEGSSLPLPEDHKKDTNGFKVNATDHGASLPHADEYKSNAQRTGGGGGGGLDVTLLDYDSDKDPDEVAAARSKEIGRTSSKDDDSPDHDTPHAVQSPDHGASLPHPEELRTNDRDNDNNNGGGGTGKGGLGGIASGLFSSIVRATGGGGDSDGDEDDTLISSEGISSTVADQSRTDSETVEKKRKKKKNKKDKKKKKKRNTVIDEDSERGDRFADEPGSNAIIAVNGDYNVDPEFGDSRALVAHQSIVSSTSSSGYDGVFRKNSEASTRSSTDRPSLRSSFDSRSRSLVHSVRGVGNRLGLGSSADQRNNTSSSFFDQTNIIDGELRRPSELGLQSNHTKTQRLNEDEEEIAFGLSLSYDDIGNDNDESFYRKTNSKRHYRTMMLMRHKNLCIGILLCVVFLALLIPLAILASQKRNSQPPMPSGSLSDNVNVVDAPTPAPTIVPQPSDAPTLPPVAEDCIDYIRVATEMAGRDCFSPNEFINITFTQCYPQPNDWIGLFPSGSLYFGRLWREYLNWIWTCGRDPCTEEQVTQDLPLRGKFSTPRLDPGDYQLFIVLDSGWPFLPLVSSEIVRVREWCEDDGGQATAVGGSDGGRKSRHLREITNA